MKVPATAPLVVVLAAAALLQGCVPGAMVAAQVAPVAMGSAAIVGAEDHDPFMTRIPDTGREEDLDAIATRVRRAECGDAEAQYWFAARLDSGYNARPDYVQVYKWYRLAEMGGFSGATPRLAALNLKMTRDDIARAFELAEHWQPATENCPA